MELNATKFEGAIKECQFSEDVLRIVFERLFDLRKLSGADIINFTLLEPKLDEVFYKQIDPINFEWERSINLTEEEQAKLALYIGHLQNFFERQKSLLFNTEAMEPDDSEED